MEDHVKNIQLRKDARLFRLLSSELKNPASKNSRNLDIAIKRFNKRKISGFVRNKRVFLVRIPKTASATASNFLGVKDFRDMRIHHWCADYLIDNLYGRGVWDAAFTFSFVRNPWDRAVSWYAFKAEEDSTFKKNNPTFEKWVKDGMYTGWEHQRNKYYCQREIFWCQKRWITDKHGESQVSYVGRFETFQEDMDKICDILGVFPVKQPVINKSSRSDYHEYYGKQTIDIVAEKCKIDIAHYGYEY